MSQDKDKARQLHDFEQAAAMNAENFPPMWKRMYENLVKEGFTEDQAMRILLFHVHGMSGGKIVC